MVNSWCLLDGSEGKDCNVCHKNEAYQNTWVLTKSVEISWNISERWPVWLFYPSESTDIRLRFTCTRKESSYFLPCFMILKVGLMSQWQEHMPALWRIIYAKFSFEWEIQAKVRVDAFCQPLALLRELVELIHNQIWIPWRGIITGSNYQYYLRNIHYFIFWGTSYYTSFFYTPSVSHILVPCGQWRWTRWQMNNNDYIASFYV